MTPEHAGVITLIAIAFTGGCMVGVIFALGKDGLRSLVDWADEKEIQQQRNALEFRKAAQTLSEALTSLQGVLADPEEQLVLDAVLADSEAQSTEPERRSQIPPHHPQPGVGRCGFCEHFECLQPISNVGICAFEKRTDAQDFGKTVHGDLDHCDHFSGNPCDCHACAKVRGRGSRIYVLCPECGNKRCPKASDHELACTGSNEPGQKGSVYE